MCAGLGVRVFKLKCHALGPKFSHEFWWACNVRARVDFHWRAAAKGVFFHRFLSAVVKPQTPIDRD